MSLHRRIVSTTMLETEPPVPFALVCLNCWNTAHLDHAVDVSVAGVTVADVAVTYTCQRCGATFAPAIRRVFPASS